jgi:RNA polymerase sigma-70 factor, ECF subfamily
MTDPPDSDTLLIQRVRRGETEAWNELIARYEGRLLAFVGGRLRRREAAEDVVQETFVGFLTSLPNYDAARSLESYLFSIAAHKLTDHLRREGRRPTLPLATGESGGEWEPPGTARTASSALVSGERKAIEKAALGRAMAEIVDRWRADGEWTKVMCQELLHVRGLPNKQIAERLKLSEQQVANQKFEFVARLRTALRRQGLSEEVFPELHAE